MGFFSLLLLLFGLSAQAEVCDHKMQIGEKCRIEIDELRPLRFDHSPTDVERAHDRLRTEEDTREFLKKNRVQVVIGPDKKIYLVGDPHMAMAALREGLDEVYVEVVGNFHGKSERYFFDKLRQAGWLKFVDSSGRRRSWNELPRRVEDLKEEFCNPATPKGRKCRVLIDEVRPTQFGLGMVDVQAKREELEEQGASLLRKSRAQIVIGPGGEYFLIDKHHLTRAAHMDGWSHTYAEIVENFSDKTPEEFWKVMEERHWVHLVGHDGKPRVRSSLPRHISMLKDDPYRSLAWVVRQSEAFLKTKKPFAEFEWADFFRNRIKIAPGRKGWEEAVQAGIKLATEEVSNHLPGADSVPEARQAMVQAACWENFKRLNLPTP